MADNNNPIKYSDLVKPDDSITKLIAQLDQLNDAYMNTLQNIKSEAITVKAALESVSGATESGRKSIRSASSDTDKLTRAQRDLAFAESENAKRLAELKQAQREANELNKLTTRLNQSAEGSYNRLSAQYSINKIYLNNMAIEERQATEEGRNLEAETKAIYEEMKRLQEATGKTSLNVGNYSDAAKGLTTRIENQTKQLALMRLEGKQGTDEYNKLAKSTAILRDATRDASKEINNMASDTSTLDSVLGAASAAGGGFAVFTGAMELFDAESENVQEAQRKLQAAIAITTGLQAVQNAVQKQSALMLGISTIQTTALSKAEAYRRLIQIQGTKATLGATVAQRAFNIVATANPYVLLAVALVTVIGALVLFANSTNKAVEEQKRLNDLQTRNLEILSLRAEAINRDSQLVQSSLQRQLSVAQAQGKSLNEIRKIEDQLYEERRKQATELLKIYQQDINALDDNRDRARLLITEIERLNKYLDKNATVDFEINGKQFRAKVKDAIDLVQKELDTTNTSINVAIDVINTIRQTNADQANIRAERIKQAQALAKIELDIIRRGEDEKLKLYTDEAEKQRITIRNNYERRIQDLQLQLKQDNQLTLAARRSLNQQIISLTQQLNIDLIDLENQLTQRRISYIRTSQDYEISAMKDGIEKQRIELNVGYERQIEDLKFRLQNERTLTNEERALINQDIENITLAHNNELLKLNEDYQINLLQQEANKTQLQLDSVREGSQEEINLRLQLIQQQRAIELAQNRQLTEDLRQNEADINAKYDAMVLKQTTDLNRERALLLFDNAQALEASEFDLLRNSEERKTRFRLEQEKKRLQKVLELNKAAGVKMTAEEVKTIENTIAKIDQEIQKSKGDERGNDIYGLFGLNLDDDQKEAISTSVSFAMEQLDTFLQAKIAAADAAVTAADKEVDASQRRLDAELEARANGYANNVTMAQKELDNAKRNQDKALKEQQKAQKAQAAIQTLQQIGNLVTASAMIWSQLGFPFAIPAIAVMWASFAASKIKASQLAKQSQGTESYGDGTVELLNGGSHQSGNDVDLGTKADGTQRRAEGGEFFAVINKRNSRKFRKIIPDVIKSLNNGTFANKYLSAYNGVNSLSVNVNHDSPELKGLSDNVNAIKKQGEQRIIQVPNGRIEYYKNLKRTYKN